MLKYILSALMNSGVGDQFDGGTGGDLGSLTAALKAEKDKKAGQPLDRLKDAFSQLKDMHKADPPPFDFESAHWPYGPIGAPSQSMASAVPMPQARPPQAPSAVPMPMARPADAPQAQSPLAQFFARNTAMQQDPSSGEYIDPAAAAKAGPGILNGLFG
jgi:hypothetical protein